MGLERAVIRPPGVVVGGPSSIPDPRLPNITYMFRWLAYVATWPSIPLDLRAGLVDVLSDDGDVAWRLNGGASTSMNRPDAVFTGSILTLAAWECFSFASQTRRWCCPTRYSCRLRRNPFPRGIGLLCCKRLVSWAHICPKMQEAISSGMRNAATALDKQKSSSPGPARMAYSQMENEVSGGSCGEEWNVVRNGAELVIFPCSAHIVASSGWRRMVARGCRMENGRRCIGGLRQRSDDIGKSLMDESGRTLLASSSLAVGDMPWVDRSRSGLRGRRFGPSVPTGEVVSDRNGPPRDGTYDVLREKQVTIKREDIPKDGPEVINMAGLSESSTGLDIVCQSAGQPQNTTAAEETKTYKTHQGLPHCSLGTFENHRSRSSLIPQYPIDIKNPNLLV
ncbi:hypothetical protein C8034_v003072 [Colletotrichum sidae]|uniref:Uncharacterized protein n=1 Tax=Colletotrichum sidae TaxID=1347389 RepID=A0A4R8T733_9PEZI|nr:hypothetical protein C8034_v003072 [Colletotrichum sidae]